MVVGLNMQSYHLFACVFYFICLQYDVKAAGCEINPFGTLPTPLLTRQNQFLYPANNKDITIRFSVGETVDLACPGGRLVTDEQQTTLSIATATCVTGTRFRINNANWLWRQLRCSVNPTSISRYTGAACAGHGRLIEIGFQLATNRFLRTMTVCFDQTTQNTLYTYYDLVPSIGNQIRGTPRPEWSQGTNIFAISNVNSYYVRGTQRRTINTLLGLAATSTKYIQNNNYFLSRGHLVARSDYFYAAQQNATFYFENALPQWQTFNAFNWDQAETDVQNYASLYNVRLQVWTGGYGNATLPHETTEAQIPLFLYTANNSRQIPVPDLFWKVVYNPSTKRGVALIGVNNPYKSIREINRICDDRSDLLTWLHWKKHLQEQGFSYACTITAFRRIVHWLPNIDVSGLLF